MLLSRMLDITKLDLGIEIGMDLGQYPFRNLEMARIAPNNIRETDICAKEKTLLKGVACLLRLPKLKSLTFKCTRIRYLAAALEDMPVRSSVVENIKIECEDITKESLRALLTIPKCLGIFGWHGRAQLCRSLPGTFDEGCVTISNREFGQALRLVMHSLETLALPWRTLHKCSHDAGMLGSLHEFKSLRCLTLAPQILLGSRSCFANDGSNGILEPEQLRNLLPQGLRGLGIAVERAGTKEPKDSIPRLVQGLVKNPKFNRILYVGLAQLLAPHTCSRCKAGEFDFDWQEFVDLRKLCRKVGIELKTNRWKLRRGELLAQVAEEAAQAAE